MAGTLTVSTLSDGTNSTSSTNCIKGSAKAWVNFNGIAGTIRASYNVASITKNGTGDYTVNFTTAMSDANYATIVSSTPFGGGPTVTVAGIYNYSDTTYYPTTSTVRVIQGSTGNTGAGRDDPAYFGVAVFR